MMVICYYSSANMEVDSRLAGWGAKRIACEHFINFQRALGRDIPRLESL